MKTGRLFDLFRREVFLRAYGIPHVSVRPDGERPDVTFDGVVREGEKRILRATVGFAQMRHDLVEGPEVDKIWVRVAASHPAGEAQVLSERNR
jgi:hypothetical protein